MSSSLRADATVEELEDEIAFQETLLASVEHLPDDHEEKRTIFLCLRKLWKRVEDLTAESSGTASRAAETDDDPGAAGSDTSSTSSFQISSFQPSSFPIGAKRPAPTPSGERQQKRPATTSARSAQAAAADRALQRQRLAEEQAAKRHQFEAVDAALALSLSRGQAESSNHAAARPSPYSVTSGQPKALHSSFSGSPSQWKPQLSAELRPTYQTSIYKPPPVKHEPAFTPPARQASQNAAVVDLTGDSSQDEGHDSLKLSSAARAASASRSTPSLHNARPSTDLARQHLIDDRTSALQRFNAERIRVAEEQRRQLAERQRQDAIRRARLESVRQLQQAPSQSYVYGGPHSVPPTPPQYMQNIYEPLKKGAASVYNAINNLREQFTGDASDLGRMFSGSGLGHLDSYDDDLYGDGYWDNADPAEIAADLQNLMDQIRPDEGLPVEDRDVEIEGMAVKLKPYQGTGLTWLQNMEDGTNKGGILADDMGLGKTIQAIALMTTRRSTSPSNRTTLIIAPVALLRQWRQELLNRLQRGRHSMSVFIHHMASKKKSHAELREFDVILTTFGTIASEMKKRDNFLKRKEIDPAATPRPNEKCIFIGEDCKWYRVIIDEAQNIKNRNTLSARGACQLQADFRLCMTGTPMMNSVDELHSLIKFLRIRPYNDWKRFQAEFSKRLRHESSREQAMEKLQALLKAILLRRHKKSLVNGKPILVLPERVVDLTETSFSPEEKDFYKALETQSRTTFNKYVRAGTVGNKYAHILVMLLRLRQACCHPHLVKDFGIAMAADISPETMELFAKELDAPTVARIMATNGEFECPVCYDAVENPAIFIPCGHDTCADCYVKIKEAAANGEFDNGGGHAKCPNCRGRIDPKRVIDYEVFKKVHIPSIEEGPAIEADKDGSETVTEDDETDSASDADDSETESETESLNGFLVDDDEPTDDYQPGPSARKRGKNISRLPDGDEGDPMDIDDDDADPITKGRRNKGKAPASALVPTGTREGALDFTDDEAEDDTAEHKDGASGALVLAKSKETDDGSGKKRRKKKRRGKKKSMDKHTSKGKEVEHKKKAPHKSLAELKKLGQRNRSAKKEYLRRIRKDFVPSAKIQKTIDLLKEIIDGTDEKIIVFSQWTSLLDLLEIPIDEQGWRYQRYDGSMSARDRGDAVDEFKATNIRPQVRLMLVSLKAGNAGLNLTCASQVIILDPFWNPYIEEQAIDRAHRLGQDRDVHVHRLLIEDTVEDRILALQEEKREMINMALDEGAGQRLSRLSQCELAYLFGVERTPH